ncbi:hypothetical protein EYF80_019427 [Liparis tanakae]|uniref:Uncharacterized protein n=1 Tax=Liparis tanakae TaxID=230148 RepID=A0A4Z2HXV8_9TELE|nr:hypothetical protein EYF80_019427 [Liparis tanakae]
MGCDLIEVYDFSPLPSSSRSMAPPSHTCSLLVSYKEKSRALSRVTNTTEYQSTVSLSCQSSTVVRQHFLFLWEISASCRDGLYDGRAGPYQHHSHIIFPYGSVEGGAERGNNRVEVGPSVHHYGKRKCILQALEAPPTPSGGDWSTSEFWASVLISACSPVFPERARSQSVRTLSLSHTVDVSVSLM